MGHKAAVAGRRGLPEGPAPESLRRWSSYKFSLKGKTESVILASVGYNAQRVLVKPNTSMTFGRRVTSGSCWLRGLARVVDRKRGPLDWTLRGHPVTRP